VLVDEGPVQLGWTSAELGSGPFPLTGGSQPHPQPQLEEIFCPFCKVSVHRALVNLTIKKNYHERYQAFLNVSMICTRKSISEEAFSYNLS
jgi:hypothetical protein